jgi:hypothetical protein
MSWNKLAEGQIREVIECEIGGLSLKETAYRAQTAESTCFNLRQKLYRMADYKMTELLLSGEIEVDATYSAFYSTIQQ